jgi:hypothetical protein
LIAALDPYIFSFTRSPYVLRRGEKLGMRRYGFRSGVALLETALFLQSPAAENGGILAHPFLRQSRIDSEEVRL